MMWATRLANAIAVNIVRPYATLGLPGWGRLMDVFVERRGDSPWSGTEPIWARGKLHGYEMLLDLKSWPSRNTYFTGSYYDHGTQTLLMKKLRRGDVFVDIGANEGMISLLASRLVGPSGSVIAFEPNPTPRKFLEAAISRNRIKNIVLQPYGVAARYAELPLTVPKTNSGQGSFGSPDEEVGEAYTLDCIVQPADPVLAEIDPALIKIDVEGYEFEALKGLSGTIERVKPPIIMEIIGAHLHRAGTSVAEVHEYLESIGYRASCINFRPAGGVTLDPVELHEGLSADVLWTCEDHPTQRGLSVVM